MGKVPIQFDLPLPPSINEAWKNANGARAPTKRYTDWRKAATWRLVEQGAPGPNSDRSLVNQNVVIIIAVDRPHHRKADVDNRVKPILDTLVHNRVLKDDSLVTALAVSWQEMTRETLTARVMIVAVTDLFLTFHPDASATTGGWYLMNTEPQEEAA